jgi:hypothetical protein
MLKYGDVLSLSFFNFAFGYAITRVQVYQNGLKLNGTHQLLVYADEVNILGGSVRTIKKNAEASAVASKQTRLEVNADKTKYMVMSRDQNAERSHKRNTDSKSMGRVEQFTYLGTALTDQNYIQEETNSRLKSGNACYHSVQNVLSSSLLWNTCGEEERCIQGFVEETWRKGTTWKTQTRWEDNIKIVLQEVEWGHGLELSGSE